ncbi:MAG TPA: sigma-E factor negative regulatory protein [Pseudomonas sp.]|nr:sigma-E factor negative regulatory protein [Pseudomonas sp.]
MSHEALNESLSAIMDNEANELELRRVLGALDDERVRATWSRYQLVRAVLHKELSDPRLDIATAVSAALADEPIGNQAPPLAAKVAQVGRWRGIGRLAVAASVTVAVLVGVRMYHQDDLKSGQLAERTQQPALIMPGSQTQAQLASFRQVTPSQVAPKSSEPAGQLPIHIAPIKRDVLPSNR